MSKNKKYKGFASTDEPIFNNDDFLCYFEDRVSQMIRNEVEQNFRDMFYKY
jgi:hypothetical protein